ncbi:hypothetical protein VTN77DRAFT_4540 [Rasamsonia byssochlamydoides]|uniref:mitochondrial 37S ribosomal protein mS42 n=1 Tax=Rasamsonia byssochlamydoides TaxID=89139 RepID=UPI00374442CC
MLQRILRPQGALRAISSLAKKPSSAGLPRFQTRGLHRVPQLRHGEHFRQHGVPDLLSPEGFDFAWTQYQTLMVDKLNLLTQDTIDADATPGELLIKYSKRPEMASLFNYASMAHNNHFFFNCLSRSSVRIPDEFVKEIEESCSSVESLKQDFLAAANAMFGPGFVWLAKNLDRQGLLQIVCTYNAGSPYPAAHSRRQPVDMNTHNPDAPVSYQYAGAMGSHSPHTRDLAPGAIDIQPILCVNTWQHVWLMDYGIAGKEEYLERWWDRIDWEHVYENFKEAPAAKMARSPPMRQSLSML